MPERQPAAITLLGFDYGLRRIGVAVGQSLTATASPLPALTARDGVPDWTAIEKLVDEWRPAALVVGVPYNMDGSRQEMTDRAERFGRQLHGRFHLPVHAVDETLSSVAAEERLKEARREGRRGRIQKPDIDSAAACVLLETWFNARNPA
ncbi:MAG TPA: Holliday junction resolvase RuvX [Gammaproteobacteria bacterium]|nr:Holliday junction resolvase RuvX [Gammaproteobacteria bacterium]